MKALGSRQLLKAVEDAYTPEAIAAALEPCGWKEMQHIADELERHWQDRGAELLADLLKVPENIDAFRSEWLSERGERISNQKLIELRDVASSLWKQAAADKPLEGGNEEKLHELWNSKELSAQLAWIALPLTCRILPFRHIRGRIAHALAVWWDKLKECQHCHSLYIARRGDSKYCLAIDCKRYGGAQRAKRHYHKSESGKENR